MPISDVKFWWEVPLDKENPQVHEHVFPHVQAIEERQRAIHELNLFNAKLYSNRDLPAIDWGSHADTAVEYGPASFTAENLTASVVNTVSSLIAKNKPKATPVVRDADWSIERQARQLDKYIYGEFLHQDIYRKGQRVFNDACWAQIGCLKIDVNADGEIFTERVMPDEIVVDNRECTSGHMPIQIHQRKVVNREVLIAKFPEHEMAIREAHGKDFNYTSYRTPTDDYIILIESWKRGLSKSDPWVYAVTIDGATLVYEEWERKKFPFVFLRWEELPSGFYSKSLVEEITPFQLRMNELNQVIRLSQDLISVPRIFADGSSRLSVSQLGNKIAQVFYYRGKEPKAVNWGAVHPELYAERDRVRSAAFEYAGVSQLSAQAKLPDQARLDSSKALREFNLIENQRFALQAQRYEQFYLEVAEHIIELSAMLFAGGIDKSVKFHNRTLVEQIDWSEVNMDRNRYVLHVQASSVLNMSPAGRDDIVNTWVTQGYITTQEAKGLLGHPDLEEQVSLNSVAMDNIKMTIEQLDKGEEPIPDPLQDLMLGVKIIHLTALKRVYQKAPEEIIEAYHNWITNAQALLEQQQVQAQQEALAMQNVGPEGNVQSGVATTAQGTPAEALIG